MIDLSLALSTFAVPGGITVRQREPGTSVDGRYVEADPAETHGVQASVQPSPQEDLELLPEGARSSKAITIWTPFALRTAEQATGRPADQVVYGGETYQVHHVRDWEVMAGYTRAVAVRVG